MLNKIILGDCLEVMKNISDGSVDMILCDLPYGTTQCKWDIQISLSSLWDEYYRITKQNAAMVFTASQPFTSALVMSNPKFFKYTWVWEKSKATGYLNAKKMPMRAHEDICVFYRKPPIYNPQMTEGKPYDKGIAHRPTDVYGSQGEKNITKKKDEFRELSVEDLKSKLHEKDLDQVGTKEELVDRLARATVPAIEVHVKNKTGLRYPRTVQYFKTAESEGKVQHPTQKPVELFEYLIRTYTNEGDVVLDNCIGSGTTALAAIKSKRNFIGIENSEEYLNISRTRIEELLNSIGEEKD